MKKSIKLITSLLVLCWAFISACSNCDDGDVYDSNQARQSIVADSTFVK